MPGPEVPSSSEAIGVIRGVERAALGRHSDPRGSLIAFGDDAPLPFEVKHAYFIVDCAPGAVRGEHAISSDIALISLCAAVTLDVDNGSEQRSLRLERPDEVLVVRAGVWLRLRDFDPETVIAVFGSEAYADRSYFDAPVPELLDGLDA